MNYQEARDLIVQKTRENNELALVWRLSAQGASEAGTIRFAQSLLPRENAPELKRLLRSKVLIKWKEVQWNQSS